MFRSRLTRLALMVILMGGIGLLAPGPTAAVQYCVLCWPEQDCPSAAIQNSWCGAKCGGGTVSHGCGDTSCVQGFLPTSWICY